MKVKISFDLDLIGTGYNAEKVDDLFLTFQNLGMFLSDLEKNNLFKKIQYMKEPKEDKMMRDMYEQNVKVAAQIFNNLTIEGTTDDGHSFSFNHQEPGYKEIIIVDGKKFNGNL